MDAVTLRCVWRVFIRVRTLKSLFLDEAQVKELAFMHMRTIPTSGAVLLDRWPFQCTAFDEMLVNLGTIMEKAARIPKSSLSFFCCNTEATGAVGFHWVSAVFEVIAPEIGRRAGQGSARCVHIVIFFSSIFLLYK